MTHTALTTYRAAMLAAESAIPDAEYGRACPGDVRPSFVTLPTGDRSTMKIKNTRGRLLEFAELVRKNWPAFGGGPKPADLKPARKIGAAWSATAVQVWREQIEAGQVADATRIGLEKLGARFYVNAGRPAVCIVAPKPVEGLPAEFASGRRDDGKWVTFDLVSGVAIGARGALTRAAAEKDARQQWTIRTEDARAMALRIARRDNAGTQAAALAAWCQVHGIDPADLPAALPDVEAGADAPVAAAADTAPLAAEVPAPAADPAPDAATESSLPTYTLPADPYTDWQGHKSRAFAPTERQLMVMDAVRHALSAGLQYTDAVLSHCAGILRPNADDLARGATKVQGGDFGMDVYYARGAIDAAERHAREDVAALKLGATVGQVLGALVFGDHKLTRACRVVGVHRDGLLTIEGSRGRALVRFRDVSALQVLAAMDRARDKGYKPAELPATVTQARADVPAPAAAPPTPSTSRRLPDAPVIVAPAVMPAAQPAPVADGAEEPARQLGALYRRMGWQPMAEWVMLCQARWSDGQVAAYRAGFAAAAADPAGPPPSGRDSTQDAPARGARVPAGAQAGQDACRGATPYGGIRDDAPAARSGLPRLDGLASAGDARPGLTAAARLAGRRMPGGRGAIRPHWPAPGWNAPRRGDRPDPSARAAPWRRRPPTPYGGICSDAGAGRSRAAAAEGLALRPAAAAGQRGSARPESWRRWADGAAGLIDCRAGRPRPQRTAAGRLAGASARPRASWPAGCPPSIATSAHRSGAAAASSARQRPVSASTPLPCIATSARLPNH